MRLKSWPPLPLVRLTRHQRYGRVTGVALCYQLRSLELMAHSAGYAAKVKPYIMDEILSMMASLIDPR
ncbi:hypothetical protein ACQPT2_17095 [Erwinia amylovora]